MGLHVGAVTFDAADPERLACFWSAVLGVPVRAGRTLTDVRVIDRSEAGPTMLFLPVPEPKTAKNRCHVDLHTPTYDDDLARLRTLGAAVVADHTEAGRWTVLTDVEGNEFCLVEDVAG